MATVVLQEPPFGEGETGAITHDEVVEDPDVEQRQRIAQSPGDELVRLACLGDARRMVVREDHCGRIVRECLPHHFARVHARAVDRAAKEFVEGDQAMAVVEVQAAEHLVRPVAQLGDEELRRVARRVQHRHRAQLLLVVPPGDFERGLQAAPAGKTHAAQPAAGLPIGGEEAAKAARMREQCAGEGHSIKTGVATAEDERQQFRVRQAVDALLDEFFTRSFARRPGADSHGDTSVRAQCRRGRDAAHAEKPACLRAPHEPPDNARMKGCKILLGVTGGIAAYKSPDLVRRLAERGAQVQVVMTAGAAQFVTATTFQAVSGRAVRDSLWDSAAEAAMGHIELARWADLVLIAPATAHSLAALAHGLADDLLGTLCLATEAPIAVAPAMNRAMWANRATQANLEVLRERGVHVLGPGAGDQACGEVGEGRMLEPLELAELVAALLGRPRGPLAGRRVIVTAGPTRERLDPVRFISNRSSGKMGFAIARAAREAGADVLLITGPVGLPTPAGVRRLDVESAEDMLATVMREVAGTDIYISTAAVADYRPVRPATQKIKKTESTLDLALERTTDVLATVAARPDRPFVVGFAAETENVEQNARAKLLRKNLDLIAANEVGDDKVFDKEENALIVFSRTDRTALGPAPKGRLAQEFMALVATHFAAHRAATPGKARA